MDFVLISTCDMEGGRTDLLSRMINSVARSRSEIQTGIELFLLLQRCSEAQRQQFAASAPNFVRPFAVESMVSLSAARNRLLRHAFEENRSWTNTVVAFPDDDGWYPPTTLQAVAKAFDEDPELCFWFCRYSAAPLGALEPGLPMIKRPALREVVRRASSNTIFLRGDLARQVAQFDESLGVGTKNGSSEDTDVAIKAYLLSRRTAYLDAAAVGHRDPNIALRPRYYRGSLIVLARYAGAARGLTGELARKVLIGVYLVARRQLPLKDFFAALVSAFAELGNGRKRAAYAGGPA